MILTPSCLKEQKTLDYILKVVRKYNFSEKNIIRSINMGVVNSGDYLVHCLDEQYPYLRYSRLFRLALQQTY